MRQCAPFDGPNQNSQKLPDHDGSDSGEAGIDLDSIGFNFYDFLIQCFGAKTISRNF